MIGKKYISAGTRVLTWSTRLIFILLVTLTVSQITCTIVFMLMCRQSSRELVLDLDLSNDPCQSQGKPAYLASAVLLVTVFGFGCVGRKCTSVAIIFLGICDVGISIYFQISEQSETYRSVERDLNSTLSLCIDTDFGNQNKTMLLEKTDSGSCHNIRSTLVKFCPSLGEWWTMALNNESIQNCSTIIQQILENIKFHYYPLSVPLTYCGSIAYIILSASLFYVQYRDKRLPGYQQKAHMFHVPEFQERSSGEDNTDSGSKLKMFLLHILSCRCLLAARGGVRQSTQTPHDVYEFEVLPTKVVNEDQNTHNV